MPYHKHARVVLEGRLTSTLGASEIWSSGVAVTIGEAGGDWLVDPQAYADGIAGPLATWFANAGYGLHPRATLDVVKVNNITTAGLYAEETTHKHIFSTPPAGGGTDGKAPSFCCAVVTLETGAARGYAHRGRMYLPNATYYPNGSFISSADATLVTGAGHDLLDILQAEDDGDGHQVNPCVVSKHASEIRLINGVSCDNIYDYQSRRKDRLTATRVAVAFP